jgi:hypothetical protein
VYATKTPYLSKPLLKKIRNLILLKRQGKITKRIPRKIPKKIPKKIPRMTLREEWLRIRMRNQVQSKQRFLLQARHVLPLAGLLQIAAKEAQIITTTHSFRVSPNVLMLETVRWQLSAAFTRIVSVENLMTGRVTVSPRKRKKGDKYVSFRGNRLHCSHQRHHHRCGIY